MTVWKEMPEQFFFRCSGCGALAYSASGVYALGECYFCKKGLPRKAGS